MESNKDLKNVPRVGKMDVEAKLAAFRAKKAKEKQWEESLFNRLRLYILHFIKRVQEYLSPKSKTGNHQGGNDKGSRPSTELRDNIAEMDVSYQQESPPTLTKSEIVTHWTLLTCKIALWLCLWALFIELQFGAVFFTISLILFIYFSTKSGPTDKKKLSAYSVFNKDCERIQGTLTAEQMQKSMFGVPGVTS